jgi:hypothetical protein
MTRYGFVLGSNGPERLGRLTRLTFAESDANRFAKAISKFGVGFDTTVPTSRIKNTILDQFDGFVSQMTTEDELLFYFAGHGVMSHGDLYFVLDTSKADRLPGTALAWTSIKQFIRASLASRKVVILDCCHSGEAIDDQFGVVFRGDFDTAAVGDVLRGSSASILVACGPDGFARESKELGGGVLTTLLVDALGPKQLEAADRDGHISLESLRDWMWREIETSPLLKFVKHDKPILQTSGGPAFYLRKGLAKGSPTKPPPDNSISFDVNELVLATNKRLEGQIRQIHEVEKAEQAEKQRSINSLIRIVILFFAGIFVIAFALSSSGVLNNLGDAAQRWKRACENQPQSISCPK